MYRFLCPSVNSFLKKGATPYGTRHCSAVPREQRILEATWRKIAREGGDFPAGIGPVRPRNPSEVTENDQVNGDTREFEGIFITSIPSPRDGVVGGRTVRARPTLAAHSIIHRGCFRLASGDEILKLEAEESGRLVERQAEAKRKGLSRRSDCEFGRGN